MKEIIERIGVCRSKILNYSTLFHRVKIKLSRKYRVWPIPGKDISVLLDPSEYMGKYITVKWTKPKGKCTGQFKNK